MCPKPHLEHLRRAEVCRSNDQRCAPRPWAVRMRHLQRSAGQPNVPSTHMIRDTHFGNLPNPRRWLSQSPPEFRTPKVFYIKAQGRAAHPGDRSHGNPFRKPKVLRQWSRQAHENAIKYQAPRPKPFHQKRWRALLGR